VIGQLRGTLVDKGLDTVLIEVGGEAGGVGFQVAISLQTLQALPQPGQPVTLRTYLQVREDGLTLFGFATEEERQAFELLISVTGVGPRLALSALSGLDPGGLFDAIRRGDTARLTRIPGIGKKTAERLVLELRDKVDRAGPRGRGAAPAAPGAPGPGGLFQDVVKALCNLGYRVEDAERATQKALAEQPGQPIEAVLRQALRSLQRD
jgi:Holliday junction DNA helicase RuvA